MRHLLTLLVINSLTVLFWSLGTFLGVGRPTVLFRNLVAGLLVDSLTVLLWNLDTLLGVAGAALLVVPTLVLVDRLDERVKVEGEESQEFSMYYYANPGHPLDVYSDPSLTLTPGDVLALVVVHCAALLAVGRLTEKYNKMGG